MARSGFEYVRVRRLTLWRKVATQTRAEIELLLGVGVEVRKAPHRSRAEGGDQRIVIEIEQLRLWRTERRAAARDRR